MSLRFKRNYPLVLLLLVILVFLTLALGNQRIVAYTARVQDQTEPASGAQLDTGNAAVYSSQEQVIQGVDLDQPTPDAP